MNVAFASGVTQSVVSKTRIIPMCDEFVSFCDENLSARSHTCTRMHTRTVTEIRTCQLLTMATKVGSFEKEDFGNATMWTETTTTSEENKQTSKQNEMKLQGKFYHFSLGNTWFRFIIISCVFLLWNKCKGVFSTLSLEYTCEIFVASLTRRFVSVKRLFRDL